MYPNQELEAEFPPGKAPSDDYLRTRVRLLQAHRQAQDNDRLGYEFRGMSNKALATRVELLRKIAADQLDDWTDVEVDRAIAVLQRERRHASKPRRRLKPKRSRRALKKKKLKKKKLKLMLTT